MFAMRHTLCATLFEGAKQKEDIKRVPPEAQNLKFTQISSPLTQEWVPHCHGSQNGLSVRSHVTQRRSEMSPLYLFRSEKYVINIGIYTLEASSHF